MLKISSLILVLLLSISIAHAKTTYNIGIMLDNHSDKTQVLLNRLKNQIKAVVGEDANIEFPDTGFYVNNFDIKLAADQYFKLMDNDIDILIAFGVITSEVVSKQKKHKIPTILFGAINQDYNDLDITKKTSGIKNFTYLIESESYKEDLAKLKQLTGFKNVGIVVDKGIVEFLNLNDVLDEAVKDIDSDYKIIPFEAVGDILKELNDVDAIYLAGGFFLKEDEVRQLAIKLMEQKIPSFTLNSINQVKAGIMASHKAEGDIEQFFRRIALTVDSYILGTPLAEMPVFIDYTSQLTINYNTAEAIGVPIKYSLIADTDFVGDFNNILSQDKMNLVEVINQVLSKNLSLKISSLDVDLSQQNLKSAKNNYKPTISASVTGAYIDPDLADLSNGSNPEFSSTGNLNINQTLYSNAANSEIAIQKSLILAQKENFSAQQLDTIFDAVNAYFTVLILKTNAQIQLLNLKLTKDNLKLAQQSYEIGQSGKSDSLRFLSAKAQNTQVMVEAANQLEQSYISLNQLLNNPSDQEIDIEDVKLDKGVFEDYNYNLLTELLDDPELRNPFIEFAIAKAKLNAPELKAIKYNNQAVEKEIELNGRNRYLPTIALQGQYTNTFNRSGAGSQPPLGSSFLDDNYNVALTFSVPLFNKSQFSTNRQTAIIKQEQLDISKKNTEQLIDVNIRTGVLRLINEMSNINLSEVSELTAKESLELTKASYSNGAVNIVQLIDAQNNYINSQLAKSNAIYNFLITSLQLERSLGYYFFLNTKQENEKFRNDFFTFLNKQSLENR
ncbi:MAG: TolC family protein [Marinicellaceae bacterium]